MAVIQGEEKVAKGRMPRAQRERLMLDVATEAFSSNCYHACSMEEIAEASGVTKPMVYAYFGSKEGLFVACLEHGSEPLLESITAYRGRMPEDRQLWEGIRAFLRFVDENRDSWAQLYLSAPAIGGEAAAAAQRLRDKMARLVSQLIAEEADADAMDNGARASIDPLAHAFVGAAEATLRWRVEHPSEPRDIVALRLMNFAWQGFGNLMAGERWSPSLRQTV